MTKEHYDMLRQKGGYDAMYIDLLNASGFAGVLPNGNIVDRRYHPDAIPIQKNSVFGVADPIPATALDLIAAEREKQIRKGYTVEHDAEYVGETYIHFDQLAFGLMNRVYAPDGWDKKYWEELTKLPLKEKLTIAGAWVATELDIVLNQEKAEQ